MDSFFDTSVVIHYGTFSKTINLSLTKKCYEYINSKDGKFLLGYYIEEEIKSRVRKRSLIFQEALNKIGDNTYRFDESKSFAKLNERDQISSKKLYEKFKNINSIEAKKIFTQDQTSFEIRIDRFLKFLVDERVIKIGEIKPELLSIIKELGYSHADCLVLTSAIQAQEKRVIFNFVAADKHFDPNGYDFLKKDPRLAEIKFPELKNFLFEN
jgi:hypothetical protein